MSSGFKIKTNVKGFKELAEQLKGMAKASEIRKIQRTAATKAIRPMRAAVKRDCPVDEGGLKKSIDSKISVKGHGMDARVGVNTATLEDGKKAHEKDEGPRAARHLHLVLFGHITEDGTAVPANNFMKRGYENTIGQSLSIYEEQLKIGIEKAADANKRG